MDGSRCDSLYYIIPEELLQLVLNSYADVMMMMFTQALEAFAKLGHPLPSQLPFPPSPGTIELV